MPSIPNFQRWHYTQQRKQMVCKSQFGIENPSAAKQERETTLQVIVGMELQTLSCKKYRRAMHSSPGKS